MFIVMGLWLSICFIFFNMKLLKTYKIIDEDMKFNEHKLSTKK